MPKLKTRRSVAKRFKFTAGGKVRRGQAGRRHLLSGKSRKQKRQLRRPEEVSQVEQRRIERLLPWA